MYTCGSKVRSVSSLRVQSGRWSGVQLYSGMTENTVLSPVNLGSIHSSVMATENERDGASNVADSQKPVIETSLANSRRQTRPHTVPLISGNERDATSLDTSGETHRDCVKLTSYKIFQPKVRLEPRPFTAGPRVIVPPKYKCPAGLTSEDIVQGKQLMTSQSRDECSSHESKINNGRLTLDEGAETTRLTDRLASTEPHARPIVHPRQFQSAHSSRRQEKDSRCAADRPFRPHTTPSPRRCVTFELKITSLSSSRKAEVDDPVCSAAEKAKENVISRKSKASSAQVSKKLKNMETMNMNRRAQSAPPNATLVSCKSPQDSSTPSSKHPAHGKSPLGEERKFSNMYWRVRSSYHRKKHDPNNVNDADQHDSPPKGSSLRPLLYNDDRVVMRHSAGCPYKCKECFKACLVSEDYMESQSQVKVVKELPKRPSQPDPLAIVRRALGRTQPLFKRVYGGDPFNVETRPWPTYAWIDIKQTIQKVT